MPNKISTPLTVVLIIIGMTATFLYDNFENGMIFYITFLALIYSIMTSVRKNYEERKRVQIKNISASCKNELTLKLSLELVNMKEEKCTIKDIQIVNENFAVILYTTSK